MRDPDKTDAIFIELSRARARLMLLGLAASLAASTTAFAGCPTSVTLRDSVEGHCPLIIAVNDDTVALIAGLIGIERDLLLGQLFLQDGMVSAEGSHFTHPRNENFPAIKDGLAKAGAPDLEPLLIALEEAKEKSTVDAAYIGVLAGVQKAKQALQPTEQDLLGAVIETAEGAQSMLDPSGTTEVVAYQEFWGLLMVARGQLDTLISSRDPAIKQSATRMALSFDEIILNAPDPGANAPVPFDPALIATLIATLKGELELI
jgi:hypothetical protein